MSFSEADEDDTVKPKKRTVTKLTPRIREVSLCHQGMNPEATVEFYKSADDREVVKHQQSPLVRIAMQTCDQVLTGRKR